MSVRKRHRELLEYVNRVAVASVGDLAGMFGVSEMTIRRDIEHLAESKLVVKVAGGVERLVDDGRFHEAHLRARMKINVAVKQRLAEAAIGHIEPGDTIFLDGSTTIVCLAQALAQRNDQLTVVTNSLLVTLELADATNIRVISLGGVFDLETFSFSPVTGETIPANHYVRKAFISSAGVVVGEGTYENAVFNTPIKRAVAETAGQVYLLVDASKLARRALTRVLAMNQVDVMITDATLSQQDRAVLAGSGVEVHQVRLP